jgi:multiple sugar transport system substrate-binding protein
VIANYIPTGKTTATNASGIFPALNDLEGEGVMQSFAQELWQGKDLNSVLDTAEARLKSVVKG